MATPKIVSQLVERFREQRDMYRSARYNEAQLRQDFLNPFFAAVGWDVDNRKGYAEAYREVIHEDAIKIGGHTKAPDYCFRVGGGVRSFFVEAKKPSVDIRDAISPAYQLRRYAWSAKLPLSILTDFEEFAVYDCRIRPVKTDKAATARVMYHKYTDYLDCWDELAGLFSPEAIRRGALEKFISGKRIKKGTAEVDKAFLDEIESWRDDLARNIALRNQGIVPRDLNFAVQRTIDRIIFLRICEDRGIETYGRLGELLNGRAVYARLGELFQQADQRYNSGLFYFTAEEGRNDPPDELTLGLSVDDKPLKDIIRHLYFPDSPYEFSVLPAEILGHVYEQFLGKVIRLTRGGHAKVEEKPEVRKAGGVYYTPAYIVDYIVEHTVGKLLGDEGSGVRGQVSGVRGETGQTPGGKAESQKLKADSSRTVTPKDAAKLRILDPACGSGSFLIGAYQYLLDWHRDAYTAGDPEKHARGRTPKLYRGRSGQWRLTTAEKKRILLNNIYGVDIDPQAVEVTKLSLLLKVLEGESQETLSNQLRLFHERALPDLSANIKCGNSLIGPDFYDGKQLSLLDEEEVLRINAFDWKAEFPEVFSPRPRRGRGAGGEGKNPGFDAVIGNPPWGGDIDRELEYYHRRYPQSTRDHTDSFKLFVDRAIGLLGANGLAAMIVPSALLRQRRLKDVRGILLGVRILDLVNLGEDVFKGVVAPSCIFVVQKTEATPLHKVRMLNLRSLGDSERIETLNSKAARAFSLSQTIFLQNPDLELRPVLGKRNVSTIVLGKLPELDCRDAGINYQRIKVGMREKGKSDLSTRLLYEGEREDPSHAMYWKGSDIGRYWMHGSTRRFCRPDYQTFIRPNEVVRLATQLYALTPKILFRQTADRIIATIDEKGVWFGRSIIAIVPRCESTCRIEYFLGLLNSTYFLWLYRELVGEHGRVFAQVKLSKVKQLPIRTIDFSDPDDKSRHDRMVEMVERMLSLHKRLPSAGTPHEKTALQRQIDATDRQIDRLVYELYNLTDEEIAIIEEAAKV